MSFLLLYEETIKNQGMQKDPLQRELAEALEVLHKELCQKPARFFKKKRVARGLYIYGKVGVGKTFMMDLFFSSLPFSQKLRFHFHHFMQAIDAALRLRQGEKNPLQNIAKELAKKAKVICIDEFFVQDVAHAMILATLIGMLSQKISLVFTSNTAPQELYLHGVQRDRFLPAIKAIVTHCQQVCMGGVVDYRLEKIGEGETYFHPLNVENQVLLKQEFQKQEPYRKYQGEILVQQRKIPYIMMGEKGIWFDFHVICNIPRCQLDYLELATRFDFVFISNIPALSFINAAKILLFIHLVDVMYDHKIRMILLAEVPLTQLYLQGEMQETFQRTFSRLQEMQSQEYARE